MCSAVTSCILCMQVRSEYVGQLASAQSRILQQEQLHQQMSHELSQLRETLREMGKDVPERRFETNTDDANETASTPRQKKDTASSASAANSSSADQS